MATTKTPAPIDRPLSRAYLREFSGWSTAFPPGLSEPTSLRVMENTLVNRDGSLRVRPGLKYLSYDDTGAAFGLEVVGTHEAFFLNDGSRAYLFAMRELDGSVGFRVLTFPAGNPTVKTLTDAGVAFTLSDAVTSLNFTAATTYVKYLQIDNKILALSNAGEAMRIFTVGEVKTAKRLYPIEKPAWNASDKLTAIHPLGSWVLGGATTVRKNLVTNPSFETGVNGWTLADTTYTWKRQDTQQNSNGVSGGGFSMAVGASPIQTNICINPLHAATSTYYSAGIQGWTGVIGVSLLEGATGPDANPWLHAQSPSNAGGQELFVESPEMTVVAGTAYQTNYREDRPVGFTPQLRFRWYDSAGVQVGAEVVDYGQSRPDGSMLSSALTAPAGATRLRIRYGGTIDAAQNLAAHYYLKNVLVNKATESSTYFSPNGTDCEWTGGLGYSVSVNFPPREVIVESDKVPVNNPGLLEDYTLSAYFETGSDLQDPKVAIRWYDNTGAVISTSAWSASADTYRNGNYGWGRTSITMTSPSNATHVAARIRAGTAMGFSQIRKGPEELYVDTVLLEQSSTAGVYFDGSKSNSGSKTYAWSGTAHASSSTETTSAAASTIPGQATPTTSTLVSSTAASNSYNYAFFYTFANEVGESAPSQMTSIKAQRAWTQWKWQKPNANSEPTGGPVADPQLMADQLVAYMPELAYNQAISQGALQWSLYLLTWSDQDATPVEGYLVGTKKFTADTSYQRDGWIRVTSQDIGSASESLPLPSADNRINYSDPGSPSQGLVASDRLVLVHDPTRAGVIRWSSAGAGENLNFTPSKGGGFKTLTTGNLYVPAAVKLWQNPESKDTLTVLCQGVDGHSASYYMAPAQISSQSDTVTIMAFEETTATPGTVSPFGCEVLNNALYHPLENELVKSTASNYNISHKSMTDNIANRWALLVDKDRIVSAQMDNRLYYIVHNPEGEPLEDGCMGNEIWVLDAGKEGGSWSRWLIQAQSLRKIEVDGRLVMSVVRPDGIYCLDPELSVDEFIDVDGTVATRAIPWKIETNTQGANRAHDAWAHLQQANITLGNFTGKIRWGVRGRDAHGRMLDVGKVTQDANPAPTDGLPWDLDDHLKIGADLKEWRFYAESVTEGGVVAPSSGQISLVQYRYTPVSVNIGYEYGSVETFEYTRNAAVGNDALSVNGVPVPAIDTGRP